MNEIRMDNEPLQELENNASVQTWGSKNLKNNEKKMKENLRKLHAQGLFWKPSNKNALYWEFYYVNDNKEIDLIAPQVMCCIICYNNLVLNLNSRNEARRGLIIYNTTNGITTLKKHAM